MKMEGEELIVAMEMFWTKDEPGEEDTSLVQLKGVTQQFKQRKNLINKKNSAPKKQTDQCVSTCLNKHESKSLHQQSKQRESDKGKLCNNKAVQPRPLSKPSSKETETNHMKNTNSKASLKDLCASDKMRIAQLVQELAKTGEECDKVKLNLLDERNRYEEHMKDLVQQQDEILEQRRSVQQQLLDCQKLVEKYQKYLMQQQKAMEKKTKFKEEAKHQKEQDTDKFVGKSPGQQQKDVRAVGGEVAATGRAHPSPSPSPSSRPFTTMIDKLLAQGKDNNLAAPDNNIVAAENVACKTTFDWSAQENCPGLLKDRLFKVGPLEAPVMSSTHCSDMTNGHSEVDKIRVKAEEFQPLQVDQRSTSTSSSQHSDVDMMCPFSKGYENRLPLDVSATIKRVSKEDTDFVKYYRKLSPEERKRQLIAQKEALVQEQQRLKAILIEQEALLRAKQEQLHSQQQLQKHRLQFFEQMGFFPNLGLNGHHALNYDHHHQQEEQGPATSQQQGGPMEAQGLQTPQHVSQHVQQQHVGQYGQQPYLPYQGSYVHGGHHNPVSSDAMHGGGGGGGGASAYHHPTYPASSSSSSSSSAVAYMPYPPENMHVGQYPGQQYGQSGPHHMRPWTMGSMNGAYPHQDVCAGGYNMDYMGQLPLQPPAPMDVHQEGHQLPHHAMDNAFLHRHGVHMSPPNREHRKGLELPEMRSAATSPLRPVCQDRQTGQPSLQYSDEAEQPHYTVLESAQQASRQHNDYHLMNGDGGCVHDKQGNHMADMEMGQTRSPSSYPPRTPASAQPTQGEHYLLDLVEEVESIHNSNHDYMGSPPSPGSVHSNNMAAAYSSGGYSEKELSDYDEESRVLQEVFFVK